MRRMSMVQTAAALALAGSLCQPVLADAQGFGRLGRLGRQLLERTARPAPPQAGRERTAADAPASADAGGTPLPAPPNVTPWPLNAGIAPRAHLFRFAAELEQEKKAFLEASTFVCNTCEGSRDFDTWRRALAPLRDQDSAWSELLASWTVGRRIPWRGTVYDGSITVISEVPVGAVPCRQLRHRVVTRGPKPIEHQRAGLICFDRKGEYGGTPVWHEVF